MNFDRFMDSGMDKILFFGYEVRFYPEGEKWRWEVRKQRTSVFYPPADAYGLEDSRDLALLMAGYTIRERLFYQ